jgi:hypothetical protein
MPNGSGASSRGVAAGAPASGSVPRPELAGFVPNRLEFESEMTTTPKRWSKTLSSMTTTLRSTAN